MTVSLSASVHRCERKLSVHCFVSFTGRSDQFSMLSKQLTGCWKIVGFQMGKRPASECGNRAGRTVTGFLRNVASSANEDVQYIPALHMTIHG
jgi:hypothetical protein